MLTIAVCEPEAWAASAGHEVHQKKPYWSCSCLSTCTWFVPGAMLCAHRTLYLHTPMWALHSTDIQTDTIATLRAEQPWSAIKNEWYAESKECGGKHTKSPCISGWACCVLLTPKLLKFCLHGLTLHCAKSSFLPVKNGVKEFECKWKKKSWGLKFIPCCLMYHLIMRSKVFALPFEGHAVRRWLSCCSHWKGRAELAPTLCYLPKRS